MRAIVTNLKRLNSMSRWPKCWKMLSDASATVFFFYERRGQLHFFFFSRTLTHLSRRWRGTSCREQMASRFLSWLHISGDAPPCLKREEVLPVCADGHGISCSLFLAALRLTREKYALLIAHFTVKSPLFSTCERAFPRGQRLPPLPLPGGTSSSGARGPPSSRDVRQEVSHLLCRTSSRWKEKVLCLKTTTKKRIIQNDHTHFLAKIFNNLTTELSQNTQHTQVSVAGIPTVIPA